MKLSILRQDSRYCFLTLNLHFLHYAEGSADSVAEMVRVRLPSETRNAKPGLDTATDKLRTHGFECLRVRLFDLITICEPWHGMPDCQLTVWLTK